MLKKLQIIIEVLPHFAEMMLNLNEILAKCCRNSSNFAGIGLITDGSAPDVHQFLAQPNIPNSIIT